MKGLIFSFQIRGASCLNSDVHLLTEALPVFYLLLPVDTLPFGDIMMNSYDDYRVVTFEEVWNK